MEDESSGVIANRDEPIPIFKIPTHEDDAAVTSSSELEDNVQSSLKAKRWAPKTPKRAERPSNSIQDRILTSLMSQIIPTEPSGSNSSSSDEDDDPKTKAEAQQAARAAKVADRPGFSLQLMSTNFRRFNARIGIVFVLQNEILHLCTWRHTPATLSFLAIYSLLCLNPHLIPAVPLLALLSFIMIPAFLTRHPVQANDPRIDASFRGPASAPPRPVQPAPELSKDFFRNMRDLQNVMEDFSRAHDAINETFAPWTNFSDERLSSAVFVVLFLGSAGAVLTSGLVPWNFVALVTGWCAIGAGHPMMQETMLSEETIEWILARVKGVEVAVKRWVEKEVVMDEPPESRLVEIFELQKYHRGSDGWEAWLYSPVPYSPLSPSRLAGIRAKGTQFFEDVEPPGGWAWKDKKWTLDLFSKEWVEQRMITGVEIEMEGERWVYDIPAEEIELLGSAKTRNVKSGKSVPKSGWEEANGLEPRGEWRRRRWVRRVQRRVIVNAAGEIT